MTAIAPQDIRAAVAAGILDEQQAARLEALAEARHGYRAHMAREDEPFEFFRGFSEIFVAVGVIILFSGIFALASLFTGFMAVPITGMALAWLFAEYFTLRRRMTLPSIALAFVFGLMTFLWATTLAVPTLQGVLETGELHASWRVMGVFVTCLLAMIAFFWRFRLPFATFMMGLFGLGIVFTAATMLGGAAMLDIGSPGNLFNLANGPGMAWAMLAFGLLALVAAMSFDLRDPHRVSRHSASAFWLHILAAPALVNTFAYSLLSTGGTQSYLATGAALALITLVAIIIDRRSFLTAGLIYIAIIIAWAVDETGTRWSTVITLIALGGFVTVTGAAWTGIRARLMRTLPDFPLKHRLPPYAEAP